MRLLILLSLLSLPDIAKADCLACWELRKVKMTMTNGTTKTGFVYWNDQWLNGNLNNWEKWVNKFPESLVQFYRNKPDTSKIALIIKLIDVGNDSLFRFKVTTKENKFHFRINEVKEIREIDKESKRYQGAGEIPVYSENDIQILNSNPFATYSVNISVADVYFLSYNKDIDRRKLQKISEERYFAQETELRRKGVLLVVMSYD